METFLVLTIVVFTAACILRKLYNGLKKGGDYKCSACATCALCTASIKATKRDG